MPDLVYRQYVIDWAGNTVWDYATPPRRHYADPPPVALPDANEYPDRMLYLPRFMGSGDARPLGFEPLTPSSPSLTPTVMAKVRTPAGWIWLEVHQASEAVQASYRRRPVSDQGG